MAKDNPTWKYQTLSYAFPLLMGTIFLVLNYKIAILPASGSKPESSFGVVASIIIPIVITWLIATYGAVRFKSYAHSIRFSRDGESLDYIADSLLWLVVYIIMLPMANAIESLAINTPYLKFAVFMGNHLPLVVILLSGYLLYKGSTNLTGIVKNKLPRSPRFLALNVTWIVLFAVFTWRFIKVVPHLAPANGVPKFSIPVSILVFSYVLPLIILWAGGLLACRHLNHYAKKVKGSLYKSLFRDLYCGIMLAYLSIFISQVFIISTISYSSFNIGIVLIYGLVVLATLGFVLVARGARKLTLVETSG